MGIKEGRKPVMVLPAPRVPTKSPKYSSTWSNRRFLSLLAQDLVPTRLVPYHRAASLALRALIVVAGQLRCEWKHVLEMAVKKSQQL